MKLTRPIDRPNIPNKLQKKYQYLVDLIGALNEKELTKAFVNSSNEDIDALNQLEDSDSSLGKQIAKTKSVLSKRMMKELKFVPKHFHRTMWMSVGMTAIGLPIGLMFGVVLDNMGLLAIGLPIGLGFGVAIGSALDQKAEKEGRQVNVSIS